MERQTDAIVLGGGLAGLAAATYLARSGRSVVVLEKSAKIGGRGRTRQEAGFHFNVGPHALYAGGAACRVLRDLGVQFNGRPPDAGSAMLATGGDLHPLPAGFVSLFQSRLLSLSAKLETARLLARLPRIDAATVDGMSVAEWLERNVSQHGVAELLRTLFRLSTYSNEPERTSAGAALRQLQLAVAKGVVYLDQGWQSLVDSLAERAREAGVRIETRAEAVDVERDSAVRGVRLADGTSWPAEAVLSTLPPDAVACLPALAGTEIARAASARVPIRLASLDLGLRHLPRPDARIALGFGRPLYFSVHSAVARLAPKGAALIHAAYYLGAEPAREPAAIEAELVALVDQVQPGWRDSVVVRRFLPDLTVAHALPMASERGLRGRPQPVVPELPGFFVAGDWVGPEGQLLDASLASAQAAAEAMLRPSARAAA
jgi:phytoene dehydrogenase-like protein